MLINKFYFEEYPFKLKIKMPEFLTTRSTASEIEKIIYKAEKEIVIVSPFLKINKTFHERLLDASERGVPITLIYGKDDLKSRERNALRKLGTISMYFCENLHAKCYYNESNLVITSMNMHDFSEQNNREMGVLFTREKDADIYNDAIIEVQSILRIAEDDFIGNMASSIKQDSKYPEKLGYCIRCEERIDFDANKPYCSKCFRTWNNFGNIFYEETVCHSCGEYEDSSMEKPLCYSCYKQHNTSKYSSW